MHFFEVGMLVCFGAAWPVSILKSYRSRSIGGKSWLFSVVVIVGYLCGIINKILHSPNFVLWLYVLNLVMVGIDFGLWIRNRRLEKRQREDRCIETSARLYQREKGNIQI